MLNFVYIHSITRAQFFFKEWLKSKRLNPRNFRDNGLNGYQLSFVHKVILGKSATVLWIPEQNHSPINDSLISISSSSFNYFTLMLKSPR